MPLSINKESFVANKLKVLYFIFGVAIMKEFSESMKVSIFGKEYEVKGVQDEEYIRMLAEYVDKIMHTIAIKTGIISLERIAILTALNIADEMHKERRLLEENILKLEQELKEALNITS